MTATGGADVDLAARVERLTAKQRECLELVDDHATSKEIARRLGISRHTVDARLRGAIQILEVGSRREAAIIYRAALEAESYQPFTYQPPQVAAAEVNPSLSRHETESGQSADGQSGDRASGPDRHANVDAIDASGFARSEFAQSGFAQSSFARSRLPAGFDSAGFDRAGFDPAGSGFANNSAGVASAHPAYHLPHPERQPAADPAADHVADSAAWTFGAVQQSVGQMHPRFRLWGGSNDLTPTQRVAGIFIVTVLAMLAFGTFLSGIEALTLLHS